ncbi:MAG: VWA domain-containing protein [Acidobacteriota bacterium]|nr:VWA domain-containing protein [Acidobacteriota bacterium]
MRRVSHVRLAAGLAALLTALPSAGQDEPPQRPQPSDRREEVFVHFVEIDLLATDRDGSPVTDLTLDDLVVRENGKIQRAAELTRHETAQVKPAAVPAGTIRFDAPDGQIPRISAGVEPRWLVLLFDLDHTEPHLFGELQKTVKTFVAKQTRETDRIAVASFSGELSLVQSFTDDRSVAIAAIDRIFVEPRPNIRWQARIRELMSLIRDCQKQMMANKAFDSGSECVAAHGRNYVQETRRATLDYIDAMEQISRLLGGVQGRKYLFLLSHGVSLDPALEAVETIRAVAGTERHLQDLRFQLSEGVDYRRQFYAAIDQAVRGKVTFLALDPSAPPSGDFGASQSVEFRRGAEPYRTAFREARNGLDEVSGSTGGRFYGSRKLLSSMTKALNAVRGGYTLGYYSDRSRIKDPSDLVKTTVKCSRKGVRISTRRGYFIRPGVPERKLADLAIGEQTPRENATIVPFDVTIDPKEMRALQGENEIALNYSVHLVLRTADGSPVAESFHFLGHVYPKAAWEQETIEPPRYRGELELAPGNFIFNIIVRDPGLGITHESTREIRVARGAKASAG